MFDNLICMDTMVEGVHFTKKTMNPYMIGYKALAVNISDIAAMGGIPLFYLVSISIPPSWSELELEEVYRGLNELAKQYSMDLVGGDTVSCKSELVITVTVYGKVEKGKTLLRSNVRPGDFVFVIGELGGSAAGLQLLLNNKQNYTSSEKVLITEHQLPKPQVEAGRIFACSGARVALNDISDGIASEANELAIASGVTINIDYDKLPIHKNLLCYPEQEQINLVLFGGEEYSLIGTFAKEDWENIHPLFKENNISIKIIGEVLKGEPAVYATIKGSRQRLLKQGYNHFKKGE